MKKTLRFAALLLAAILTFSACGKADKDEQTADAAVSQEAQTDAAAPETTEAKVDPAQQIQEAKALIAEQKYLDAVAILRKGASDEEKDALIEQCRENLLAPFSGKVFVDDEDDMADYYWIEPHDVSDYNNYLYISCSKADKSNIGLHVWSMHKHSSSDDHIYPSSIRIKGDGEEKLDIEVSYKERDSDYANKRYYESVNVGVPEEDEQTLLSIVKDTSSLTIRQQGTHLHGDNTVSADELADMQRIAEYYDILCKLYK